MVCVLAKQVTSRVQCLSIKKAGAVDSCCLRHPNRRTLTLQGPCAWKTTAVSKYLPFQPPHLFRNRIVRLLGCRTGQVSEQYLEHEFFLPRHAAVARNSQPAPPQLTPRFRGVHVKLSGTSATQTTSLPFLTNSRVLGDLSDCIPRFIPIVRAQRFGTICSRVGSGTKQLVQ